MNQVAVVIGGGQTLGEFLCRGLAALDGKDTARALATLAEVTGKLELIVAREPTLALAGVDVRTIVHDLFANTETIEAMTDEALDAL
ncbi:YfdX family protein, partial [Klebsiella pneumoniae]